MTKKISGYCLEYSTYLLFFIAYLVVFIFVGFLFHVYINNYTLLSAFISYNLAAGLYLFKAANRNRFKQFLIWVAITPLLFLASATAFSHTYDISYDGQDYHQSAIIALSNKWDPLYQNALPISPSNPVDKPVDEGYGKTIWSIDSSIYKLTHNIDSATAINLIVGFIALSLAFAALLELNLSPLDSLLLAIAAVFTTIFIEQTFSFREDALSYELLIIGLSSSVLLYRRKNKLVPLLGLFVSVALIASIKDSNLFIFIPLVILSIYINIQRKIYGLSYFKPLAAGTFIVAVLLLFNPYVTNLYDHHAIDYPFNTPYFANSLKSQDIPINIANDNRFELFFYGIFSQASLGNYEDSGSQALAHLKVPFSLTSNDLLTESSVISKTVGGYGVLFSGILVISLMAYVYLLVKDFKSKNRTTILWLTAGMLLVIGSCLIGPAPNYSRYISQLYLIPIAVAASLLMTGGKGLIGRRFIGLLIVCLLLVNTFLDGSLSYASQYYSFRGMNSQLNKLAESKQTYLVHDGAFYSNYLKLKSRGVKIVESPKLISCAGEIILDESVGSTVLCKI